jgi:AraC-like DNA-binding protein
MNAAADGLLCIHLYFSLMAIRLSDCRFLHGVETPFCTAVVDKHFVGYSTLQFITRGELYLSYNARAYALSGRWTFPAVPGPLIRFGRQPGCASWHHRYVAVTGPLVDHWRSEGLWPEGPEAVDDVPLEPPFDTMLDFFRNGQPQRGANALEGILLLLASRRPRAIEPEWLASAKATLADPEGFRTDLSDLAQHAGAGVSTFRRAFKAATGVSPRDWAITARLTKARELLAETSLPIGTIAERLGYRDVYFFSRQFTSHTGLSPAAWRKSRLE